MIFGVKNRGEKCMNNKIKYFRMQKNMSRKQLAELVGVSPKTIAGYELKHRTPPLSTALKLARVLGTTVEELFPLENDAEDK